MPASRRQFLQRTMLGFGAYVIAWPACTKQKPRAPAARDMLAARSPRGTFTLVQWATLHQVTERVLPRDEDPGAIELGVPEYLDGAMGDPEIDFLKKPLVTLLEGVERSARQMSSRAFVELPPEEQDEILATWQNGKPGERHAFEMLLALTFEGAFGDPKYGGNKGGRGFAMTGFTPGPVMPHVMR